MPRLPDTLYKVDSVVQLEQVAITQYGIPAYDLMKRAGEAVFNVIQTRYSHCKKILILSGAGNNAGDGFVVASLAKKAGYTVQLVSLVDPETLKNEAGLAFQDWLHQDGSAVTTCEDTLTSRSLLMIENADLIVDALLGTGLKRDVSAAWAKWISAVNQSAIPVLSVDIPSGLHADTGVIADAAIKADVTVCFIGLKQGMFTAQGRDVCGEIVFSNLSLSNEVYTHVESDAQLIRGVNYALLPKRKASSHKGNFGHVLIVGGNEGMPGAVILSARAALRCGVGLVTIITIPLHLEAISNAVPEAMVKTCEFDSVEEIFKESFIHKVTHIAIGMGLGQDEWSLQLLRYCLQLHKPMVIDADALNLIAMHNMTGDITSNHSPLIVTPHPGEAGRLLSMSQSTDKSVGKSSSTNISSSDVEQDRFSAVKKIHALLGESENCCVILKGSGTLLFNGRTIKVCMLGNAAMAAPGVGDVLSGIVIALMAQGLMNKEVSVIDIAELAVCLHAAAAESFTGGSARGLLASDIVNELAQVLQ